jgi:hypothetical protein
LAAILERIDALLGPNRRAKFIRDAVENELRRRDTDPATAQHGRNDVD